MRSRSSKKILLLLQYKVKIIMINLSTQQGVLLKKNLGKMRKKLNEILKSQLQNTNERLDKISSEVLEITKSLEVTQGKLNEELVIVKKIVSKKKPDMQVLEDDLDPNEVPKKLLTLEDRSRCNNLCFDSITEDTNEA